MVANPLDGFNQDLFKIKEAVSDSSYASLLRTASGKWDLWDRFLTEWVGVVPRSARLAVRSQYRASISWLGQIRRTQRTLGALAVDTNLREATNVEGRELGQLTLISTQQRACLGRREMRDDIFFESLPWFQTYFTQSKKLKTDSKTGPSLLPGFTRVNSGRSTKIEMQTSPGSLKCTLLSKRKHMRVASSSYNLEEPKETAARLSPSWHSTAGREDRGDGVIFSVQMR